MHYDGWSRKYDEYMYIGSRRLAPNGLYTKRADIPRYRMHNYNQSLLYANVIDSARQNGGAGGEGNRANND